MTTSRCSLVCFLTSSIFLSPTLQRSRSFCIGSFTAGRAVVSCGCKADWQAFSTFMALVIALSISLMFSSESFSPSSAVADSSALVTSSSPCFTCSSCSARSALPLMSLSAEAVAFLAFVSSPFTAFNLVFILARLCTMSPPLASFCLAATNFLASPIAADTSLSRFEAFSDAALMSSTLTSSKTSGEQSAAASARSLPFLSAVWTASSTSAITADIFLSIVSDLKLFSFFDTSSSRCWSSFSSSMTNFADSLSYRLASASFCFTKVFACSITLLEAAAAFSDSVIAFVDSSAGRTSMPFRKGISAS
mmetsp:Transcript_26345/g.47791  ORF Transcript_26345/g.47791 Transcript_26345/m.47791 type:complete len:307 (-) Transcript_26345:1349-2269(-)